MQVKRNILILINPVSGISNKDRIRQIIKENLDDSDLDYEIKFTGYPGHGTELAQEAVKKGLNAVVVAGGDGSVNEVAKGLVNTNVALGIIPAGSGNGLAHFLHLPFNLDKAINTIRAFRVKKIDAFTINDKFGCNLAGAGFDAKVAVAFSKVKRRGFWTYFKIVLHEYFNYKPRHYVLEFDGNIIERKALMVCFANSNQFGNNAVIAPEAIADDGLIDICIISKVPLVKAPLMGSMVFFRRINKTHYAEYFKTREVIMHKSENAPMHIDGDPVDIDNKIHVKVNPLSLNVIVP